MIGYRPLILTFGSIELELDKSSSSIDQTILVGDIHDVVEIGVVDDTSQHDQIF